MRILVAILFSYILICASVFDNAAELVEAYKSYGFKIEDSVNIEKFKHLSQVFTKIEQNLQKINKDESYHTTIKFVDADLMSKVFMLNGVLHLTIPKGEKLLINFNQYLRAKKIQKFLQKNKMISNFTESNLDNFERFIKFYNLDKNYIGTYIHKISFENVLYPIAALESRSQFKIVLPIGDKQLYWSKVFAIIPDSKLTAGNIKNIGLIIGKSSQVESSLIIKKLARHKNIFYQNMKSKAPLDKTKLRNKLIRLLAREFPPVVLSKDVRRAIENIPYRRSYYKIKKNEILEQFKRKGMLKLDDLHAVYLSPLRIATLHKIIELIKYNRDLKNLRLSSIRFENKRTKPSVAMNKKTRKYTLTLSDFATRNNIYTALKNIPLK